MSASVVEQILAAAAAALGADRARVSLYEPEDLPARNIRRAPLDEEAFGDRGSRLRVSFDVEHHVKATTNWETAADALHMDTHTALMGSPVLAALGRGLRCVHTETEGASAEVEFGKLTATYQMQVLVRPGDLTRAIT